MFVFLLLVFSFVTASFGRYLIELWRVQGDKYMLYGRFRVEST